jgi:uncharacterized protein (UPF0548 family)
MRAPCRVIYTITEPRRKGFAYGTLPGHPESGEEAFTISQCDDLLGHSSRAITSDTYTTVLPDVARAAAEAAAALIPAM